VHFEGDGDERPVRPFELLDEQEVSVRHHGVLDVNPSSETSEPGVKGKAKELDRVLEEDQKSTAPSEVAEEGSIYYSGSKVRLVASAT
jgi:hypothetical protein